MMMWILLLIKGLKRELKGISLRQSLNISQKQILNAVTGKFIFSSASDICQLQHIVKSVHMKFRISLGPISYVQACSRCHKQTRFNLSRSSNSGKNIIIKILNTRILETVLFWQKKHLSCILSMSLKSVQCQTFKFDKNLWN